MWKGLYLTSTLYLSHTPSSSMFIATERKYATHTCTPTEDSNHNIVLFILFSLFGNCRVNNFINHITWHDAPKFILFTGIHWIEHKISQWIQDWHFADCTYNSEWQFQDFLFFFFSRLLPSSPCRSHLSASRPPDSLMPTFYFALVVEVCWLCFTSTICIEIINGLDTFLNRTFVPLL